MASRQHNLRPASARRIPQRYKNRDKEGGGEAQTRKPSGNHTSAAISSARPQSSRLGKYCAFPSRPLNDPDPGPSELVKAMGECCFPSEKTQELERILRGADSRQDQGTQASTPTSPRMALVARLPPMESGLAKSPDDLEAPLVREEIEWGSDSNDEPPCAYSDMAGAGSRGGELDVPLGQQELL